MSVGTKLTHTGVHKYAIPGKRAQDVLSDDERELYELCRLASVETSPAVFRILLDLLKHNVSPVAIVQMLKTMIRNNNTSNTLLSDSSRYTGGSSTVSSRGVPNSPSGLSASAASSRRGASSGASSARSTSSMMDSSKKSSRLGSGAARAGTSSGRQKSGRDTAAGQRQPKS